MFKPLKVTNISGKGRGVVCQQAFKAGEVICENPVIVIPKGEYRTFLRTTCRWYIFDWPGTDMAEPWNRNAIALGVISLVNHSETPNCDWNAVKHSEQVMTLVAIKPIKAGEELTINYQWPRKLRNW